MEADVDLTRPAEHQCTPSEGRPRRVALPSLRLGFSERKLLLVTVDLFLLDTALLVTVLLRPAALARATTPWDHGIWFVTMSLLWLAVGAWLDVYALAKAANALASILSAGGAALVTGLLYLAIPFLTPSLPSSRGEALLLPVLAAAGVALWRATYATILVQPAFRTRVLVVGAGSAGATLVQAICQPASTGTAPESSASCAVLGFVDDDPDKQSSVVAGVPVLGNHHDLLRLAGELRPDMLVLCITDVSTVNSDLFNAILDCHEMGIHVTTMATLYERVTGRVPVEHAGYDLNVVMPLERPAVHRPYLAARRIADIVVSLGGCLVVLLLSPAIWLANRLTSPGELFYLQERVGRGGRPFYLAKFRSMVMDAENGMGPVWAAQNDRRATPVGRLLRKTRIDEFPQFWNVLKGEMTIIGPRPERPEFVDYLATKIPFYRIRHAVAPGITGWAQVNYGYGASTHDALVKLEYDLYYIKHQGLYLDLLIALRTLGVILGFRGR